MRKQWGYQISICVIPNYEIRFPCQFSAQFSRHILQVKVAHSYKVSFAKGPLDSFVRDWLTDQKCKKLQLGCADTVCLILARIVLTDHNKLFEERVDIKSWNPVAQNTAFVAEWNTEYERVLGPNDLLHPLITSRAMGIWYQTGYLQNTPPLFKSTNSSWEFCPQNPFFSLSGFATAKMEGTNNHPNSVSRSSLLTDWLPSDCQLSVWKWLDLFNNSAQAYHNNLRFYVKTLLTNVFKHLTFHCPHLIQNIYNLQPPTASEKKIILSSSPRLLTFVVCFEELIVRGGSLSSSSALQVQCRDSSWWFAIDSFGKGVLPGHQCQACLEHLPVQSNHVVTLSQHWTAAAFLPKTSQEFLGLGLEQDQAAYECFQAPDLQCCPILSPNPAPATCTLAARWIFGCFLSDISSLSSSPKSNDHYPYTLYHYCAFHALALQRKVALYIMFKFFANGNL